MSIFELEKDRIVQLPETSFSAEGVKERQDLQRILRSRIEVLDPDLLIIAEEYGDWEESRRRIDLLALDRDAKLVVIELKRTDDGGHMELQALRYAAMVSTMTFTQAVEAYRGVLTREGKDADPEQGILDFLAWDDVDEERFASDVRLLLVAQDFSREITNRRDVAQRAATWISVASEFGLTDSATVCCSMFSRSSHCPEAADYQVRIREKVIAQRHRVQGEWTGYFYVNVDEGDWRSWEDFRRYGFVSAGGGPRWSSSLRKLQPGDKIYAYQKGRGYVGLGEVVAEAVPAKDFTVGEPGTPILDEDLSQPGLSRNRDDPETCEWLTAVRWIQTVAVSGAYTMPRIFANQNVVCRTPRRGNAGVSGRKARTRRPLSGRPARGVVPMSGRDGVDFRLGVVVLSKNEIVGLTAGHVSRGLTDRSSATSRVGHHLGRSRRRSSNCLGGTPT